MRILLDENLPVRLADALRGIGHDVEHVYTKHLSGRPDPDVRLAAEADDRLLISQDVRFADARLFASAEHPGFVLVRLKNPSATVLIDKLTAAFEQHDAEAWRGCFVVVTDTKIRVRRPPP